MAGVMFTRVLLPVVLGASACGGAAPPEQPAAPAVVVAVPLSGPDAAAGEAAVRGARLAIGAGLEVVPLDDTEPDLAARVAAMPAVLGVVAHVTRRAAEDQAEAWRATDLPVIVAAPGAFTGLPRVVPPIEESAKCAAAFLDAPAYVRTDGSPAGMAAGKALVAHAPDRAGSLEAVDARHMSSEAARIAGRDAGPVAWAGDAATGGNLLRALRQVGSDEPFLGIGLYDARFLEAAGKAAEGARVTDEGRPARGRAFADAFRAHWGAAPPVPAVDAFEGAALLVAAWRAAGSGATRASVRQALTTASATGASGAMSLGPDGVVRPVLCASFRVSGGAFVFEGFASEEEELPELDLPGRRRKR